jgi:2,4-dienoyl-CoA reductase-like NADH-dependent reductase (Old Yellow Enzyme family)/thioredoxin reductase
VHTTPLPSLADPLAIGGLTLKNRVITAPMERNYCELDGRATERYQAYLEARARGGAALVQTESSYVRADGRAHARQMGVHNDAVITDLTRLAERIHRHDALLGIELNHGGRIAQSSESGYQPVAPSPIPCVQAGGDVPLELQEDEILELIGMFASATRRCREAGVDIISIHAAHGYLIHQFLSRRTNHRQDAWAEPTRFLDAVLSAVREEAGPMPVGIRISAYEGGAGSADAATTRADLSRARLDLVDFIDVSAGTYEGLEWMVQPGDFPQGVLRRLAAPYRAFGKPVSVAGRVNSRYAAQEIVASGDADMVTVGRAIHADPDWPRKVLAGGDPRPCIACNLCGDMVGPGEPILCTVNPDVGREYLGDPLSRPAGGGSSAAPRVTVIGGGPAGLEAARSFALGGWAVTLLESEHRLGGQFALAASLHEYPEYGGVLRWYAGELAALGVRVELGATADLAALKATDPYAVVLATGAVGYLPPFEGRELPRVRDARDWIRDGRPLTPGATHVVWGTDREGVAVADDIAARGGRVLLVGATDELAPDVGPAAKNPVIARLTASQAVEIRLGTVVVAVGDSVVTVSSGDTTETVVATGPVLVSQGVVAQTSLLASCRELAPPGGVYVIGDAAGRGGRATECIADGRAIARELQRAYV